MQSTIERQQDRVIVRTGDLETCFRDTEAAAAVIALLHQHIIGLQAFVRRVHDDRDTLRCRSATLVVDLPRITEVPAVCKCGWRGTVGDAEPDVDGDGSLGCPECGAVIVVKDIRA
jgi:hypothetical protein